MVEQAIHMGLWNPFPPADMPGHLPCLLLELQPIRDALVKIQGQREFDGVNRLHPLDCPFLLDFTHANICVLFPQLQLQKTG